MVNPGQYLVRAVLAGFNVLGRAFIQSYRRVAQSPAQSAEKAAGGAATTQVSAFTGRRMRLDEAEKILNIDKDKHLEPQELRRLLNERYKTMYELNSVENGGSFYLQSKLFRAKEVLEAEFRRKYQMTLVPKEAFLQTQKQKSQPNATSAQGTSGGSTTTTPPSP